jgi:methyl-accepting chemotaxis protein
MRLQTYLTRFSIAQRLWFAFGIVLAIQAGAVVTAWIGLADTGRRVSRIVDEIQPAVLASTAMMNQIKEATTALGFYLLTQEDIHKNAYAEHLKNVDGSLVELRSALNVDDEKIQSDLREIERLIGQFRGYQPQLVEVATQQNKNYAALGFAGQHINPLSQEMLQSVASMISSELNEPASEKRRALLVACEELRYLWSNVMTNLRVYVIFGNKDVYANMKLYADSAGAEIAKIKTARNLFTFEQEEAIAVIEDVYARFQNRLAELARIFEGDRARMDAYLIRAEVSPLVRKIDEKVSAIVDAQRALIRDTSDSLGAQIVFANGLMVLLLVSGLGVGGVVSVAVTNMIARPLRGAARAMQDIARGEGDLTRRLAIEGRDEIGTVADAFNQFAGNIQELIRKVGEATRRLTGASAEMNASAQRSCVALDQQKHTSAEIVTSIQQMTESAANVAQGAENAAVAARKADEETNSGRDTVNGALAAINTLATETQDTANVIEQLGQEIQSIGTIIDVIRGITEQTNLLALNAAIEAARAGEQGRGFAVVADEVRTLATRTQSETRQIQEKVERLQREAGAAVQRMVKNSAVARSTIELASKAGASLRAITAAVSNITQMTEQIASAAEQQSSAANSVHSSVEVIKRLTAESDRAVGDVGRQVNVLNQLSSTLDELITRFKV